MCKKNVSYSIKIIVYLFFIIITMSLLSCVPQDNPFARGDKILIVHIHGESSIREDISERGLVLQALEKGGTLILDVDILRRIDPEFDIKYTATDSRGSFYTRPAILNFIGGQGWRLLQVFGLPGDPQYFFVKSR